MSQVSRNREDASNTQAAFSQETAAFAMALLDPDIPPPQGVGKKGTSAPKRFAVYRNNVVVSLMEALAAAYPSLLAIMGKENFDKVARVFVIAHPPSSPMMQQFGAEFPDFLQAFKPLRGSPFLTDVARAERAWLDAWHAVDEHPLSPEELGAIAPEKTMELVFTPMRATTLIRSDHPVYALFQARNEWPAPGIDLKENQNLLITRPGLECITQQLDASQAVFFHELLSGTPLGSAIGEAMTSDEAFDPTGAIALMLQSGAFTALEANQSDI